MWLEQGHESAPPREGEQIVSGWSVAVAHEVVGVVVKIGVVVVAPGIQDVVGELGIVQSSGDQFQSREVAAWIRHGEVLVGWPCSAGASGIDAYCGLIIIHTPIINDPGHPVTVPEPPRVHYLSPRDLVSAA